MIGGINIYNKDKVISDVKKYKNKSDYVFVMPHWGTEGTILPKLQEIKDARQIIEAGADGVIASHAHIVQPTIKYQGKVISMNLGNFAFPDRYVVKPRISYYPTDEELNNQDVPVVNAFKPVERLSYKIVCDKERKGEVLGVTINDNIFTISHYYTELTKCNVVVKRNSRTIKDKVQNVYVSSLMKDKSGFFYRLHKKLL